MGGVSLLLLGVFLGFFGGGTWRHEVVNLSLQDHTCRTDQHDPEQFKMATSTWVGRLKIKKKKNNNQKTIKIKRSVGVWASSRFVLQGTSFKTTDVKTKFSGLDSNIIYKAQISLFTCHMERNAVNRVAAAAVGGDAEVAALVSLVQVHLC